MKISNLSYGATYSHTTQLSSTRKSSILTSQLSSCSLPKSSCKLVAPTVEALSWEPSRCVLPFLASREALVLSTVTWDGVLDGWLFTWEVEGWEAWLRASWRLLEEKGEGEEMRSDGGQRGTVITSQGWGGWHKWLHKRGIAGGVMHMLVVIVEIPRSWLWCLNKMLMTLWPIHLICIMSFISNHHHVQIGCIFLWWAEEDSVHRQKTQIYQQHNFTLTYTSFFNASNLDAHSR